MKPPETSPRQRFLDGLEQGRLLYQFDEVAGKPVFYPREVGPSGKTQALVWRESSGLGVLYSFTCIGKDQRNIALVDLQEGFRMMSTIVEAAPESLRIGMSVRFRVEQHPEHGARAVFEGAP